MEAARKLEFGLAHISALPITKEGFDVGFSNAKPATDAVGRKLALLDEAAIS